MKILVTGAGGFIGSHLTELLLQEGHDVRALVHYNGAGHLGHLSEIGGCHGLDVQLGDVTDSFRIRELVKGCDVVIHLAALIGIPYSYIAPAQYVSTNISGTLNVLEACRSAGTRRVVITSTSEVYGTARYTPIDEDHPLQGQSPYSATKIAADKLAESYARSFDLPVVTLRPFNTFGPRQSARAVIPTILSQALRGAKQIELGNLDAKRDLTFVEDTAQAFLLAATTPGIEGEVIHFGHGEAITIGDLAQLCLRSVDSRATIVTTSMRMRPEKSEVGVLLCDATKARKMLQWSPRTDLLKGLAHTADYIRSHPTYYQTNEYTV